MQYMKTKKLRLDKKESWGTFLGFFSLLNLFNLTDQEIKLLIWKFYNEETYDNCAKLLGKTNASKRNRLSRQRIEQLIKTALKKIYKQANTTKMKGILDGKNFVGR